MLNSTSLASTVKSKKLKRISTKGMGFLVVLSMLMAFTSLSVDIYLPAMPKMQTDLHGNIELTITSFLIGFSIGQLIWGGISDHTGRRLPLIIGLVLFIIGAIGCAISDTLTEVVFWRVIQALGACTGPMIARAMIRDLYTKTRAAQMLSTLMIIMAIAPIIGPLIGGQIIIFTSWHGIFWLLSLIGLFVLVCVYFLPETLSINKRTTGSIKTVFINYTKLVKNRVFMRYALCITSFYAGIYAFIAGSPFIYISYYHVPEQYYGWLFGLNILGVVGLSFVNRKWVGRYGTAFLLSLSTKIAMIAAVILIALVYAGMGNLYVIIFFIFIIFAMNGIIAACATAAALDGVGEIAGSASALIGSLQYGSGIVSSILLALFHDKTPLTMVVIIALFVTCSALIILKQKAMDR